MKKILFILLFCPLSLCGQALLINEIMADNETVLQDEFGNFPDWIELYNNSDQAIDLLGYSLSDDKEDLLKWPLPAQTIQAKSFLVILASGENTMINGEIHANFKIDSDGENLFLSNSSQQVIDEVPEVDLEEDLSYTRIPDGGPNWTVAESSSPGTSNNFNNLLLFSNPTGCYSTSFELDIESLNGDSIFYTLNGEIPSPSSQFYGAPISIVDRNQDSNVLSEIVTTPDQSLISYPAWKAPVEKFDKATILRCASFKNGIRSSPVISQFYLVGHPEKNPYGYPIISLVADKSDWFDEQTGIYVPGMFYDAENPQWSGNYFQSGDEWEKFGHMNYLDADGDLQLSQNCGIRIHGGKTRQATQKSLRLYAREEYGKKYFNHPFFPTSTIDQHKRLILRTTMASWGEPIIIKDILVHEATKDLNFLTQDYQPAVVFLNGEYWGMHTIRERIDEWFVSKHEQIDKDTVQVFNWNNETHYWDMIDYITENDLSTDQHYNYVKTQMDMANYIDYIITEVYFGNSDWPCNNVAKWRPETEDGKWQWILKDVDAAFYDADKDLLDKMINPSNPNHHGGNCPSYIFQRLINNEEFVQQFIDRFVEIMNHEFRPSVLLQKLDTIKALYRPGLDKHMPRWQYPESISAWENSIEDDVVNFIYNRPCVMTSQLEKFFSLPEGSLACHIEQGKLSDITIGPNPTTDQLNLICNFGSCPIQEANLYDALGKLIWRKTNFRLNPSTSFDVSRLAGGVYFMQVNDGVSIETFEIVIQ